MISPGGSDGPSWTVTMPMLSTGSVLLGIERVGGLDRAADDDRVEAVDLVQLVLPADQRLELVLALHGVAGGRRVSSVMTTNSARLMA